MTNAETKTVQVPTNQAKYNDAVKKGLEIIARGESKAEAARAIYEVIKDESRDVIVQAFIDGAKVTEKGAPTYFYNVRRQYERKQREASKASSSKGKKKDTAEA